MKLKSWKTTTFAVILTVCAAVCAACIIKIINQQSAEPSSENDRGSSQISITDPEEPSTPNPTEPAKPDLLNLQPVVDAWVSSLSQGSAGVVIYDLDHSETVASYRSTDTFSTESLYKLFVVYEGYRRIEAGTIDPSTAISAGRSWAKCLDLAIRESNSPCAEAMRASLGADALNRIIKSDYDLGSTDIVGLTSTPADIAGIMKLYYAHPDFSDSTWATIQDTMLDQPPVDNGLCSGPCVWRQGLPAGFSSRATVYDKVGWAHSGRGNTWASYHDAAIVEFPEQGRHYIIVVMTKNSLLRDIVRLGEAIEEFVLEN